MFISRQHFRDVRICEHEIAIIIFEDGAIFSGLVRHATREIIDFGFFTTEQVDLVVDMASLWLDAKNIPTEEQHVIWRFMSMEYLGLRQDHVVFGGILWLKEVLCLA